jgi:hypothetical protein
MISQLCLPDVGGCKLSDLEPMQPEVTYQAKSTSTRFTRAERNDAVDQWAHSCYSVGQETRVAIIFLVPEDY